MNRRGFLGAVATVAAVAVADPEKLLWVPGKKTIFIPSPALLTPTRLIVGIATAAIRAGNYGNVQVYGPYWGGDQVKGPRYQAEASLHRRVKAERDLFPGDVVYSDMVDYGNAPLWYTKGQNDIDVLADNPCIRQMLPRNT